MKRKTTIWIRQIYFLLVVVLLFVNKVNAEPVKGRIINGVPSIQQFPELPTGCEITAMTMLANYHGVPFDKMKMASLIPRGQKPYRKNGIIYGSDPRQVFVGNPEDKNSYGVYHQPIVEVLGNLFPRRVENLTGRELEELFSYIRQDLPVMIWTTFPTRNGSLVKTEEFTEWKLDDGSTFTWVRHEHAMILIGFTSNYRHAILNDPLTGKQQMYPMELLRQSYQIMGKQAIVITRDKSSQGKQTQNKNRKEKLKTYETNGKPAIFSDESIYFQGNRYFNEKYRIDRETYVKVMDYAEMLVGKENQFEPVYLKSALHLNIGKRYRGGYHSKTPIEKKNKIALLVDADLVISNRESTIPLYQIDGEEYISLKEMSKLLGIQVVSMNNGERVELQSMFY